MHITGFTLDNLRCFAGEQRFEVRPLTLLVGENSTGKTTVLGCFQVLADYLKGEGVNFNVDPYQMGVFSNIVRNGKANNSSFKIGRTFYNSLKQENFEYTAEFVQKEGGLEPTVSSVEMKFADGKITITPNKKQHSGINIESCNPINNTYHLSCPQHKLEVRPMHIIVELLMDGRYGGNQGVR